MSKQTIHKMLTRPYYKGTVIYAGAAYHGTHEPLVQPEVWYQVQAVLRAHLSAVDRTQRHTHYLKGSLYCGECGSRLTMANARSSTGKLYPYFVCSGRHSKRTPCTRSAIPISRVERMVEDYYQHMQIPAEVQSRVREQVREDFDVRLSNGKAEMDELTERQRELEGQQEKLLNAHLAGAVPLPLLQKRQTTLELDLQHIRDRIAAFNRNYTDARQHLEDCLRLLGTCHELYREATDRDRRLCNQAFFERIYIDEDGSLQAELARPFGVLADPVQGRERHEKTKQKQAVGPICDNKDVGRLNIETTVDAMEHYGNRRPRVERLVSAWNQGICEVAAPVGEPDDPLMGASEEPSKRPRTRLTDSEVDAMQTARAQGISVNALARQFGVHRGTVWAKTR